MLIIISLNEHWIPECCAIAINSTQTRILSKTPSQNTDN